MAQGNPRGTPENLTSFNKMDKEKAREIHSKGGKAHGQAYRKRKAMRENLEMLLSLPVQNDNLRAKIEELGIANNDISNQMAITISLFNEALHGNVKAYELIRDTVGEKPIDKQEIKQITTEWFKE